MDLELSGTCYHDGPRTYDLDMGEIRCGQCGGLLAENADPCQECREDRLTELEVAGVKLCRPCYDRLSDQGEIRYCNDCQTDHYGEDEMVVVHPQDNPDDLREVCRECYRKLALAGEVGPGWLPLDKALEWDTLRKAPYLHFTYVVGQIPVPDGMALVTTDWLDAITGDRGWVGGGHLRQCADLLAEAKKVEPNWRRREYLVLLDRSTHNVCSIGMDLLSRPRQHKSGRKAA